jgi:membrane protein implicated in regulation of membrane protease activity
MEPEQQAGGIVGWLKARGRWLAEYADPLLALVSGVAVGVAGVFGAIKGDALPAATLLVLSVVAFALLRERSQRIDATTRLNSIEHRITATDESVKALHSRSPYRVVSDDTLWDIQNDGELTQFHRKKKIRLLQDDVLSLFDWGWSDGEEDEPDYTGAVKVDSFSYEGRQYSLLSLRRFYPRNSIVDLGIRRTLHGALTAPQERINMHCLDPTDFMVVTVQWPLDRAPRSVRLNRVSANGERSSESAEDRLAVKGGRTMLKIEEREPERRSVVTIEWDW